MYTAYPSSWYTLKILPTLKKHLEIEFEIKSTMGHFYEFYFVLFHKNVCM